MGLEFTTLWSKVICSTDWDSQAPSVFLFLHENNHLFLNTRVPIKTGSCSLKWVVPNPSRREVSGPKDQKWQSQGYLVPPLLSRWVPGLQVLFQWLAFAEGVTGSPKMCSISRGWPTSPPTMPPPLWWLFLPFLTRLEKTSMWRKLAPMISAFGDLNR